MSAISSRSVDSGLKIHQDCECQQTALPHRQTLTHLDFPSLKSFLDDIERLMSETYTPTDVDVLNARLKTIGVIEHSFTFDRGSERGVNWTI